MKKPPFSRMLQFIGILGCLGGLCWHSVGLHLKKVPQPFLLRIKGPILSDPLCQKTYAHFFKNHTIHIKIVFGYKDARPARFVADRYEKTLFIQTILKPCQKGENSCGFVRAFDDADLFKKSIIGLDDQEKTVLLKVVHSSVGPDDDENRLDPFQKWQTAYARDTFLDGLQTADALFYNGHSRDGGGPDFEPARLRSNHHVAYDWYKAHPLGLNDMLEALNDGPSNLKLLGLFSCASDSLFLSKISQTRKKIGLITSKKLIYFSDALENSLLALSALLSVKCQPEFRHVLQTSSTQAGIQMIGFFDPLSN